MKEETDKQTIDRVLEQAQETFRNWMKGLEDENDHENDQDGHGEKG